MVGGHLKPKKNIAGSDSKTKLQNRTKQVQLLPKDCLPVEKEGRVLDR